MYHDIGDYPHKSGQSLSLCMTQVNSRVCRRLLPIGPKEHMQKGFCVTRPSLLPVGGRGKFLSVWVRLGKAKSPYAKEVLYDAFSLVAHNIYIYIYIM